MNREGELGLVEFKDPDEIYREEVKLALLETVIGYAARNSFALEGREWEMATKIVGTAYMEGKKSVQPPLKPAGVGRYVKVAVSKGLEKRKTTHRRAGQVLMRLKPKLVFENRAGPTISAGRATEESADLAHDLGISKELLLGARDEHYHARTKLAFPLQEELIWLYGARLAVCREVFIKTMKIFNRLDVYESDIKYRKESTQLLIFAQVARGIAATAILKEAGMEGEYSPFYIDLNVLREFAGLVLRDNSNSSRQELAVRLATSLGFGGAGEEQFAALMRAYIDQVFEMVDRWRRVAREGGSNERNFRYWEKMRGIFAGLPVDRVFGGPVLVMDKEGYTSAVRVGLPTIWEKGETLHGRLLPSVERLHSASTLLKRKMREKDEESARKDAELNTRLTQALSAWDVYNKTAVYPEKIKELKLKLAELEAQARPVGEVEQINPIYVGAQTAVLVRQLKTWERYVRADAELRRRARRLAESGSEDWGLELALEMKKGDLATEMTDNLEERQALVRKAEEWSWADMTRWLGHRGVNYVDVERAQGELRFLREVQARVGLAQRPEFMASLMGAKDEEVVRFIREWSEVLKHGSRLKDTRRKVEVMGRLNLRDGRRVNEVLYDRREWIAHDLAERMQQLEGIARLGKRNEAIEVEIGAIDKYLRTGSGLMAKAERGQRLARKYEIRDPGREIRLALLPIEIRENPAEFASQLEDADEMVREYERVRASLRFRVPDSGDLEALIQAEISKVLVKATPQRGLTGREQNIIKFMRLFGSSQTNPFVPVAEAKGLTIGGLVYVSRRRLQVAKGLMKIDGLRAQLEKNRELARNYKLSEEQRQLAQRIYAARNKIERMELEWEHREEMLVARIEELGLAIDAGLN